MSACIVYISIDRLPVISDFLGMYRYGMVWYRLQMIVAAFIAYSHMRGIFTCSAMIFPFLFMHMHGFYACKTTYFPGFSPYADVIARDGHPEKCAVDGVCAGFLRCVEGWGEVRLVGIGGLRPECFDMVWIFLGVKVCGKGVRLGIGTWVVWYMVGFALGVW